MTHRDPTAEERFADVVLPEVDVMMRVALVVDIRQDREAAASVRLVAGGCETVPTVAVGLGTVVNPPTDAVVRMIELEVPHLLPEGGGARPDWLRQLLGSSGTKDR